MNRVCRWVVVVAGVLVGCGESGSEELRLTVDQREVSFGAVFVGASAQREVRLGVPAPDPDNPPRTSLSGTDVVTAAVSRPNAAGQLTVTLTYAPTEPGDLSATLRLVDPVSGLEASVALSGRAAAADLDVTPTDVDFGAVVLRSDATRVVTLTNRSTLPMPLSLDGSLRSCAIARADPFCAVREPGTLAPGASVALEVRYTPSLAGVRDRGTGRVRFCESPACEVEVLLVARPAERGLCCTPELALGAVTPGRCVTETAGCRACTNLAVDIRSAGTEVSSLSVMVSPTRLSPGQELAIPVQLCPTERGRITGFIAVVAEDEILGETTTFIDVSGRGGGPDLVVDPVLELGRTVVGAMVEKRIPILNEGDEAARIEGQTVTSGPGGELTIIARAPEVLEPGAQGELVVSFLPGGRLGPWTGGVQLQTNDADQPTIDVEVRAEVLDLPACVYSVSDSRLDFGGGRLGNSLVRTLAIINETAGVCLVRSVAVAGGTDDAFSLVSDLPTLLPAGTSTVAVRFTPLSAGAHSGELVIDIASPGRPVRRIALTGDGAEDEAFVMPQEVLPGVRSQGCRAVRTVTLYNGDDEGLRVDQVSVTPAGDRWTVSGGPTTVAPGGAYTFSVTDDGRAGTAAGVVRIDARWASGPTRTFFANLETRAAVGAEQVDRFVAVPSAQQDLLLVLDHSGSTTLERLNLSQSLFPLPSFAGQWQIGVTSSDIDTEMGALFAVNGARLFDASTPEPSATVPFIGRPESGGAASDESSFEAGRLALLPAQLLDENQGLRRREATLGVLYMSDEVEPSPRSVSRYVDELVSVVGVRRRNWVSGNTISGPETGLCQGPFKSARGGPRYIELPRRTGGAWASMCDADWGRIAETVIRPMLAERRRYFLSAPVAFAGVPRVRVDGVDVPSVDNGIVRWTFNASANAIDFPEVNVPRAGTTIEVRYPVACD